MEEYKKYFNLICYMIKNNFNQEFYSISQEIKRKLNINFSTIPLFVIFLIYQYSFVLLLLLALYQVRNSMIFNIIFGISMICNMILPGTIARTSTMSISKHPWIECLQMSNLSKEVTTKIIFWVELVNFWIHNIFMEIISLSLLIIKFKFLGILYCVLWIILVSLIFLRTLSKNSHLSNQTIYPITSYLFNIIFSIILTYKLFEIFIGSLNQTSFSQLLKPNQIDHYIIIYIKKLIFVFTNQVLTISVIIMALLVLKNVIYIFLKKVYKINEMKIVVILFNKYSDYVKELIKNFWVYRDLRQIFNIITKVDVNPLLLIFPSGIFFIITSCLYYFIRMESHIKILISLVFISWVTLYQYNSFLIQKIPIFNISSELRNCELIKMSKHSIEELISAKKILLCLFSLPILLCVWSIKLLLLPVGINPIILALSVITDMLMCYVSITLVLKWTYIMPSFTWKNIFMIKQDNYDQQMIQHFLLIPGRLITLFFSISFIFVNIVKIDFSIPSLILYFILNIITLSALLFIMKRRVRDEIKRY